jgi:Integrase core domain
VGTVRRECLDRMLIFNERQLVHVLSEYERHDNTHRPHRALDQRSPMAADVEPLSYRRWKFPANPSPWWAD